MSNARLVALEALLKVNIESGYSNIVIDKIIKKYKLSDKDKSLATAIFYGVLERKITLDYVISQYSKTPLKNLSKEVLEILRIGIFQLLYMDKIPSCAAVNESVNLVKIKHQSKASGFVNGILRTFLRNDKTFKKPKSKKESLSIEYSCPVWIIELWIKAYGEKNTLEILKSLVGRPPINIRVNNLKTSRKQLKELLISEGLSVQNASIENALNLSSTGQIDSLKSYKQGLFHVQDIASQICCKVLNPQPGDTIIDVCSAPGGKAFTLAEIMGNVGQIFAFDQYDAKVNLIKSGVQRLGVTIIEAQKRDARKSELNPGKADKILCDVPCSGLGIMRRKPEIRYREQSLIEDLPEIQYDILCKSANLLKIGGTIVYSTCTLNPAENSEIAERFLKEHSGEYEPQMIDYEALNFKRNDFDKENQLTLMPHIHGTDGFFIAVFKKVR